jgi:SM-20-related protein
MNSVFDAIADGLADQGYAMVDQFLSQSEVDAILLEEEFISGVSHFKKAGIGDSRSLKIQETIRGDYIKWLDKESSPDSIKIYLHRLQALTHHLNQALFLSLKDIEVHLAMYPVGTFYKRHLDQFKKNDHRRLSVVCYLNRNWTDQAGGQLRMYVNDQIIDVLPTAGKLICFRSDLIEHEVLPATRDRFSITGWMLDQLVDLK